MEKNLFHPRSLVLQWHITERCNWRCGHCYQENYNTPEMDLQKMKDVLEQYVELVKKWRLPKQYARIQITGGEPFLRTDLFAFLEMLHKYSDLVSWTVMSNGSLLDGDKAGKLKSLGIRNFQVSLEGLEKTNDEIRGRGSFRKIIKAIELLNQANILVRVSLTLTKNNCGEIGKLAEILAPLNVGALAVRRIIPSGLNKSHFEDLLLEPMALRNLYREIENINREMARKGYSLKIMGGCESAVFNDEISAPGLMSRDYCIMADGTIITLMPDGDVLICRRCPIKIGNVYKNSLEDIYYSPVYKALIEKKDVPFECKICSNLKECFGGAKCVTYALTGKTAPDIQCWKLFANLHGAEKYIKSPSVFKKIKLLKKCRNQP